MERLSRLQRLREIERGMGAFYSPVVSWVSSARLQYVAVVTQKTWRQGAVKQKGKRSMGYKIKKIDMCKNATA